MILGLLLFTQLSGACASGDAAATLASVASVESGFDTLAINDNTTGSVFHPTSEDAAQRLAYTLIVKRGHSVDLGLMQVNSANLSRIGLSIKDAFDACHSIAAGAHILKDGYQQALRVAFSRYNTGSPVRGFANGYVHRVEAAGGHLPALNTAASLVDTKPAEVVTAHAAPAVVLDMLHFHQVADSPQGVSNLLSGVAPVVRQQGLVATTGAVLRPAG